MKRIIVRSLVVLGGVLVVAVAGGATTVNLRWKRTFEAPYPEIKASTDSAVIARGEYIVYGPGHCAYCHTPPADWEQLDRGEKIPLRGGNVFKLPFGNVYSRNLTPDEETGIGKRTDGELARMLRHDVRADGRVALPFMEFLSMSDEDLTAVISFLRAQQPVSNLVPDHEPNTVGKGLYAFVFKPRKPVTPPPAASPASEPTVERGEYIARNLAGCVACHTNRSMMDGSFTGPEFAGGLRQELEADPSNVLVTPNLTPDPETGHIVKWSEEQFVARFRQGMLIQGTHMPWAAYRNMTDNDLRAIYRFLNSLEPVKQDNGAVMQPAKPDKS